MRSWTREQKTEKGEWCSGDRRYYGSGTDTVSVPYFNPAPLRHSTWTTRALLTKPYRATTKKIASQSCPSVLSSSPARHFSSPNILGLFSFFFLFLPFRSLLPSDSASSIQPNQWCSIRPFLILRFDSVISAETCSALSSGKH
ncbi:hypothetical protein P175DRAFT_0139230 [Aspergillus ochraceoroseus IBT 24754]|uniref:Uncharacterized protein n=1 Tax=Aspergillus ochraceoroseus IBT 24754 TaxID=1392256 RepID=A0A2T5M261_9EURO|nr:uncharacterized protein P175DRAFT_0139230 [Aspergillus ochraceoroseus IBT 24754]PTU22623.1 hypothetical protein P175DRAFT_0139230 [Aspergillus ochraceoroseus IBT 24754]